MDPRDALRDRLMALLEDSNVRLDEQQTATARLIDSGKLDSLSLFKVALFVEAEVGHKIDIASFDLAKEWNTIDDILNFIATQRALG
ncbi:MAG TPA: hypothetical protein VGF89_11325 [Steroidobacteraceae bacterium]|jgi:acyl carrier protein